MIIPIFTIINVLIIIALLDSYGKPSKSVGDVETPKQVPEKIEKPHKKKKPELKKAKEVKEKVKSEKVKTDKKTVTIDRGLLKEEITER